MWQPVSVVDKSTRYTLVPKQDTYGALIRGESMPEAEAAKLFQRLRAAALLVRIQKPVAQHGGSGIFAQLPRSHVCSHGCKNQNSLIESGSGKTGRLSVCCHSTSAAPASTLFQTKSSAAVCEFGPTVLRERAYTILPGWLARSRGLELCLPPPPASPRLTGKIK